MMDLALCGSRDSRIDSPVAVRLPEPCESRAAQYGLARCCPCRYEAGKVWSVLITTGERRAMARTWCVQPELPCSVGFERLGKRRGSRLLAVPGHCWAQLSFLRARALVRWA